MASRAPHIGWASGPSLATLLSTIPSLKRPILSRLVARMIEHPDELDGDPDFEPNGDEMDGSDSPEECFLPWASLLDRFAGCPLSDPGEAH